MNKKQKYIMTLIAIICCFILITFIWDNIALSEDHAKNSESFEVNVCTTQGVPLLSMIKMFSEKPYFEDNVTVTYENIQSSDVLSSKIMNNDVDIALIPTNVASVLYNKGAKYTLCASTIWGNEYIIGPDNLNSIEDLKGKSIAAFGEEMAGDIILKYIFSKNGIDPYNDISLNYFDSASDAATAYISGEYDIAVLPEPVVTKVLQTKDNTKIVVDVQDEWSKITGRNGYPQESLIISNNLIAEHESFVDKFLLKYKESIDWVNYNVNLAGEYCENLATGMTKELVEETLQRDNIKYVSAMDAKDDIELYLTTLSTYDLNNIGGNLPKDDFYYKD